MDDAFFVEHLASPKKAVAMLASHLGSERGTPPFAAGLEASALVIVVRAPPVTCAMPVPEWTAGSYALLAIALPIALQKPGVYAFSKDVSAWSSFFSSFGASGAGVSLFLQEGHVEIVRIDGDSVELRIFGQNPGVKFIDDGQYTASRCP
jgi:hypothetical protein